MSDTRTRILTATAELFRRQGYNGSSLKDITTRADATTGSLYHFWPGGKDELTAEVLRTTGEAYGELFEAIIAGSPDVAQGIDALFAGGADLLESTDYIDPCPIGTVAREVASTNEGLRATALTVFDGWIERGAVVFGRAGLPAVEAQELAATVVAAVEGGFIVARTSRSTDHFRATGRQLRTLAQVALARSMADVS